VVDQRVDLGDLALVMGEQLAQRTQADRIGLGQRERVELGLADRSPQLRIRSMPRTSPSSAIR
jgi:hypothetical protein